MRRFSFLLLLVLAAPFAQAQKPAAETEAGASGRAARAFDAAKKQGPLALHDFLVGMPKGADLHVHLSGAVYAESWLRAADEDGLCVDTKLIYLILGMCHMTKISRMHI